VTGKTHLVGAVLAGTALTFGADPLVSAVLVAAAAVGSKAPDLDRLLDSGPSHRSLPHSLGLAGGGAVLVAAIAATLPEQHDFFVAAGFAAGYLSHLLLDALTPSRVPLLLPGGPRFGLGVIPTGSLREGILCFLMTFLLAAVLVLRALAYLQAR